MKSFIRPVRHLRNLPHGNDAFGAKRFLQTLDEPLHGSQSTNFLGIQNRHLFTSKAISGVSTLIEPQRNVQEQTEQDRWMENLWIPSPRGAVRTRLPSSIRGVRARYSPVSSIRA